ncbi:MAG: hypothetical protein E7292_00340 [Lachnospiraceae bacterium]|nr:hypothetical protein [Lachnospiraceae bacterium]
MWEGSYGSEPFDLRLTILRMIRNLGRIVLFALAGTVLFGGGYYVKNVLLGESVKYEQTITCKMEYTNPPVQSGDYYVNDMTWNTYVDSEDFRNMLKKSETFVSSSSFMGDMDGWTEHEEGLTGALNATVASDIHVPSFTVSTPDEGKTELLSRAVQEVLVGEFAESIPEVASIRVMDVSEVAPVKPDVRPMRAFILAAVLSFFFVMVFFLLVEIGADSIWLPATLRRRYGLRTIGTINSPELLENLRYILKEQKSVAVCAVDAEVDVKEVVKALQDKASRAAGDSKVNHLTKDWIAVEGELSDSENTVFLHGADGVLLVVKAGLHSGKPLEYVLEYFATQDIQVSAAILWDADEALIRSYYILPDSQQQ